MTVPPDVRFVMRVLLAAIFTYGVITRVLAQRRLRRPLPRDADQASPARLDARQIVEDVRALSDERFEGRRTSSDGGRRARAFVAARFRELGLTPLGDGFLQPFGFLHRSIRALWQRDRPFRLEFPDAANVLGLVRGRTHPEHYLVVSAHYDHLGRRRGRLHPGADDNASGVAALLALAAYFQSHPPEHSLVLAAFDAEELGRRGARAFVSAPAVPLERIRLDVNLDMIGRGDNGRLFVAGTHHAPFLVPYVARAAQRSRVALHLGHDRPVYLTGFVDDWSHSSDHAVFHEHGIPFLYFGVEHYPEYHQPGDTFERIPQEFLVNASEAVLETLLTLDREWFPGASGSC